MIFVDVIDELQHGDLRQGVDDEVADDAQ